VEAWRNAQRNAQRRCGAALWSWYTIRTMLVEGLSRAGENRMAVRMCVAELGARDGC
jgi:hypothetical protein